MTRILKAQRNLRKEMSLIMTRIFEGANKSENADKPDDVKNSRTAEVFLTFHPFFLGLLFLRFLISQS